MVKPVEEYRKWLPGRQCYYGSMTWVNFETLVGVVRGESGLLSSMPPTHSQIIPFFCVSKMKSKKHAWYTCTGTTMDYCVSRIRSTNVIYSGVYTLYM